MNRHSGRRISLFKKNGSVEEVTALVGGNEIHSNDVRVIIEEGDMYERTIPNGSKKYYWIVDRGFYKGAYGIPDNYQSRVEQMNKSVAEQEINNCSSESKLHKFFISHSSKDKEYMIAFVKLLEDIGMPDGSIICSSVSGHGIPSGAKTFAWLRNHFLQCDLRMIFALSHNYYDSTVCLNEMGATWLTKATDTLLLLPEFKFDEIKGCIDSAEISIKLDGAEEELKHRLAELKDALITEYSLAQFSETRWERHRDAFIKRIGEITDKRKGTVSTNDFKSNGDRSNSVIHLS